HTTSAAIAATWPTRCAVSMGMRRPAANAANALAESKTTKPQAIRCNCGRQLKCMRREYATSASIVLAERLVAISSIVHIELMNSLPLRARHIWAIHRHVGYVAAIEAI